jgi:hypothetical protein
MHLHVLVRVLSAGADGTAAAFLYPSVLVRAVAATVPLMDFHSSASQNR